MKQPQSSRSPSSPPLVTRVRGQLGTILLLGCKGGQNVPQYRPRAVSHDFHPLTFQYGKIPNPCKSTVLSIHGVAVRKETGGGNPSTRGPGDQVRLPCPRILEWVAVSFSKGSSWPRDRTRVSCTGGRLFTIWATREAKEIHYMLIPKC